MTIERITREKAESLIYKLPSLGSILPLKDESAEFYMISEEGFLSVTFNVAVVEEGDISYITDERLRESVNAFLESK